MLQYCMQRSDDPHGQGTSCLKFTTHTNQPGSKNAKTDQLNLKKTAAVKSEEMVQLTVLYLLEFSSLWLVKMWQGVWCYKGEPAWMV